MVVAIIGGTAWRPWPTAAASVVAEADKTNGPTERLCRIDQILRDVCKADSIVSFAEAKIRRRSRCRKVLLGHRARISNKAAIYAATAGLDVAAVGPATDSEISAHPWS
jgi:hypothetical protein